MLVGVGTLDNDGPAGTVGAPLSEVEPDTVCIAPVAVEAAEALERDDSVA